MPKLIIEIFEKIILEYLNKINTTDFTKLIPFTKSNDLTQYTIIPSYDKSHIISIGLNTIIHIFKIILCKYKNTDIAYHYTKQGYYYFLEYIQQLSIIDFQHNLNMNDAIIFVYSKTLSVSLDELNNNQNINFENNKFIINNLSNIINTLLQKTDNTVLSYISIIKNYLSKILYLFSNKNNEKYFNYFFEITVIEHIDEFYKNIKKLNKLKINKTEYEITCKILEYKFNYQTFLPL